MDQKTIGLIAHIALAGVAIAVQAGFLVLSRDRKDEDIRASLLQRGYQGEDIDRMIADLGGKSAFRKAPMRYMVLAALPILFLFGTMTQAGSHHISQICVLSGLATTIAILHGFLVLAPDVSYHRRFTMAEKIAGRSLFMFGLLVNLLLLAICAVALS